MTDSPTTGDIAKVEHFALSVVQSRPTRCRYVCLLSGREGTNEPSRHSFRARG
jgi:hypothetical protein